ncbi:Heparin cofactor 2 [Saguinus oedipus]|uniref:Heparin cofactor 2 n=1 Tax=Saguinus oedipus TaxID=9490 RepID=A0ABQ9WHN0_SAGOE|nr:Heparin cofactor 2 [Saguinus oedipus]
MKHSFHPLLIFLIITSAWNGSKGLLNQLEKEEKTAQPADLQWKQINKKNLSTPLLPADFHKENTVTNDWIPEGEEDDDYLDLEKILSEDDDYIDIIDSLSVSPTDSEASAGNILQLFHGKSRIQRLNILNAKFAFNLYRALKDQVKTFDNIFLAPVGISTAMGMISLGLKGETHEQVHSILHFKDFVNASSKYEIMTIHNLFRKLTHRLFRRNFGYTLRSVNDLYIQKQFPILADFKTKVREYYFAEAQVANFSDPAFISKTNNHILKLTKGLIKDALENIDPATQMMILNCIYFKDTKLTLEQGQAKQGHSDTQASTSKHGTMLASCGWNQRLTSNRLEADTHRDHMYMMNKHILFIIGSWVNKFPVEMTHNHNFRLNEQEVVKVPMMQTKGNFLAANDQELDCDILQLEYVGGISMLIVVPHKLSGMKTLEAQLTPQVVERWQKSMTNRTREVLLPKFKLEKNYNLVEPLKLMGITTLFDQNGNMEGISDQRIAIDLFKHQGTITVNEEGTQAAAVTTVGFMPLSTQVRFTVDRPFLFLIYEHRTSCLLFMGRVVNPSRS